MRLSLEIILLGTSPFKIPVDYRTEISSLIEKTILREAPKVYSHYWRDRTEKIMPFTFSLFIPPARLNESESIHILECSSNTLGFQFSSCDFDLLNYVYNGLLKVMGQYSLFDYTIEFRNFFFQKLKLINDNRVRFRILSPVVVPNRGNKEGKRYITWEDMSYSELLINSVETLCRNFIKPDYHLNKNSIEIIPSLCSTTMVEHLSELIPATNGIIEIRAPVEVLRLIYDAGLGTRRSQGFGMVDIAS
jgi:CRISPR-associated endoribonuclease Cas6